MKGLADQLKTFTLNFGNIMKLLMNLMQENDMGGGRPLRLHCDNYFPDGQLEDSCRNTSKQASGRN